MDPRVGPAGGGREISSDALGPAERKRLRAETAEHLRLAADHIESCGFHRRDEDLAEWQAVLGGERLRHPRLKYPLSSSEDGTVRLWDVAGPGPGNLVEAACRLLPDKDVSTLRGDFGIDVSDPICSRDGRDAPAPDFRELVD